MRIGVVSVKDSTINRDKILWLGDTAIHAEYKINNILNGKINKQLPGAKGVTGDIWVDSENHKVYNIRIIAGGVNYITVVEYKDKLYWLDVLKMRSIENKESNTNWIIDIREIMKVKSVYKVDCKKGDCNLRRGEANCKLCRKTSFKVGGFCTLYNEEYKIYTGIDTSGNYFNEVELIDKEK